MRSFDELLEKFTPLSKLLTLLELPFLFFCELYDLFYLAIDKPFKRHARPHWLSTVLLKGFFLGIAIAAMVGLILGSFGLAFPILYLILTCLGAVIKAKAIHTDYATQKADMNPKSSARRKRFAWFELGLKIVGCVAVGLLLFLPGTREIMLVTLLVLAAAALFSYIKRPKIEKNWALLTPPQSTRTPRLDNKPLPEKPANALLASAGAPPGTPTLIMMQRAEHTPQVKKAALDFKAR